MYKYQYGFRKYHSTEYAALQLLDYLNSEVDARRIPLNVYLDLTKAFDFLSHSILLDKLKHYGVEETIEALGGMDIMPKHSDICRCRYVCIFNNL